MTLRVFVPNHGRVRDTIAAVWNAVSASNHDGAPVEIVPRRVRYIAAGVGHGCDIGVTAEDLLADVSNTDVRTLAAWQTPVTTLCWCVPRAASVVDVTDLDGAVVATEFPNVTKQSALRHGISITTVTVPGDAEHGPRDEIADAVVTSIHSGRTIRGCGLRTIGTEIMTSRRVLVCRQDLSLSSEIVLQRFLTRLADDPNIAVFGDQTRWRGGSRVERGSIATA